VNRSDLFPLPDSRPALWYAFSQGRATNERHGIEERELKEFTNYSMKKRIDRSRHPNTSAPLLEENNLV